MAKISKEQWQKAKAMFEGGASLNEIAHDNKIDKSTISKKAKKEGWIKGVNSGLIVNEINHISKKSTLNQQQLNYHNTEVKRELRRRRIALSIEEDLDQGLSKAAKRSIDLISSNESTMQDIERFGKFQNDARVGLGLQDKFNRQETQNNDTQPIQITITKAEDEC